MKLVLAVTLAVGCNCGRVPEKIEDRGAIVQPAQREEAHQGVRFLDIFANGADETSPLVLVMHGLGGSPEQTARNWRVQSAKVELVFARGFNRYDDGWSWFDWPPGLTDDEL